MDTIAESAAMQFSEFVEKRSYLLASIQELDATVYSILGFSGDLSCYAIVVYYSSESNKLETILLNNGIPDTSLAVDLPSEVLCKVSHVLSCCKKWVSGELSDLKFLSEDVNNHVK